MCLSLSGKKCRLFQCEINIYANMKRDTMIHECTCICLKVGNRAISEIWVEFSKT